jgi:MFS superfamily sulfate permease-like transporter
MRAADSARRPPGARAQGELAADLAPSVVVFLVALPLCLGIAHGSGAPLVAGMISGIVVGLLVGVLSGSQLGVSGPAAGLTTIVLAALSAGDPHHLGYPGFLLAVVLSGVMQLGLGALQAGIVAYYFPSNVIKGLLAAIGALIILKQLPHALGIDTDWMGDEALLQEDGRTTFTEPIYALTHLRWGALVVAAVGLAIIVAFDRVEALKRLRLLRVVPAPLLAVLAGLGLNALFPLFVPGWTIAGDDLVRLPEGGPAGVLAELTLPDVRRIGEPLVWSTALTLAAVASLETLLCVEAIDKLDPHRRSTPTNRELFAQAPATSSRGCSAACR